MHYIYKQKQRQEERYMINLNMLNLNSSNIINEQLNECYEQLPDISDMTTEQTLQYMQVLYMAQLCNNISWIKEHTEGIANTIADKIF